MMIVGLGAIAFALMLVGGAHAIEENSAARLDALLNGTPWGMAVERWQHEHPDAVCERLRSQGGGSLGGRPEYDWCMRCRRSSDPDVQWSFYAFGPAVCRLGRLEASVSIPSDAVGPAILSRLVLRLDQRLGPAAIPPKRDLVFELVPFGALSVRRWSPPGLEVYAFLTSARDGPGVLGVDARHAVILDTRSGDRRWNRQGDGGVEEFRKSFEPRLRRFLGAAAPDTRMMTGATQSPDPDLARRHAALAALLAEAARASGERRAAALLAADSVAEFAVPAAGPAPDQHERIVTVRGFTTTYRWGAIGGGWNYDHELLHQAWREHSTTTWGEIAFARALSLGWDTDVLCRTAGSKFLLVIREGRTFLAARPASRVAIPVLLSVAMAYETWWSLSQSVTDDDHYDWIYFHPGAEAARHGAIKTYEEILSRAPATAEAWEARRQLPRLRLGYDTAQRRFFCIYD